MKIEFYTNDMKKPEATALVRLLQELFGADIVPERKAGFPVEMGMGYGQDPRAVDGFPMAPTPEELQAAAPLNFAEAPAALTPGQLDSAGVPWDERIHASTKTTNKDGTWTRRRNTPDAVFDAVMAELKGAAPSGNVYGNTDKGGVGPDGMITLPTPEPEETSAAAAFAPVPTPPAPPVPTPPAAVPTPTAAAAPAGTGFVDMMELVTQGQRDGKLPDATLQAVVQAAGAAKLGDLVRPDAAAQRANVIEQLKALLA